MSDIPFVNQLGDAIETALARPAPTRRRFRLPRRRWLAVSLAALAVAGSGAAVAGLLHDPVEIGFGSVACFEGTEPEGNIAVIADPTRRPADLCATAMRDTYRGLDARDLIACMWPGHGVAVVVRGERGSCAARGLAPLPPSYTHGRRRAARLQDVVQRLDLAADCAPPLEFARRLTRRLHAAGWPGWRAVPPAERDAPCGRVSVPSGRALLGSIGSEVNAERRTIQVHTAFPLHLERLVYDAGSPGAALFESSWSRCFSVAGLERHVREQLAAARIPIAFSVRSLVPNAGISGAGGDRYAEGCAVYSGAYIRSRGGRTEIVAELTQRDAPQSP
jgi:hypothetical protein